MSLIDRVQEIQTMQLKPKRKNLLKRWWFWTLLIILILFVWAALYVYQTAKEIANEKYLENVMGQALAERVIAESNTAPSFGAKEPKITIVEFGDYSCPFTQIAAPIILEAYYKHPEDIKIIWRDFLGHEESLLLAKASRCFHEQNQFENFYQQIFTKAETIDEQGLEDLAINTGLNLKQYQKCQNSTSTLLLIKTDNDLSEPLEIKGTPTWMVNGHKFVGTPDKDSFLQLLDNMLK